MLMSLPNYFYRYFSPDEGVGMGGDGGNTETPSGEMGKEESIEFLGLDDTDDKALELPDKGKKPEAKDKEPKGDKGSKDEAEDKEGNEEEEESEADRELKAIEEELEEKSEEELELVTPVRRREILKKYPDLFKDFPYLEKAYYLEQQYSEAGGSVADVKAAVEKATLLDRFEADVTAGNTEAVIASVKKHNPDGFNRLVDNYLPTLRKVDENAFFHVIGNVTKHTILAMVSEAKRSNNADLQAAAQVLNQFTFGSSKFTPPTNLSKGQPNGNPQLDEQVQREEQFQQQRFADTVTDLNDKVNNILRKTIDGHIDPNQSMSDYIRKNASKDVLEKVEELIGRDARFKTLTDRLWRKAADSGFSKESVDAIKSAYLSKAKTLLPSVIKKARNDALRGMGRRVKDDVETPTSSSDKKGPMAPGKPRSNSGGKITSAKDIPKGMSSLEFLNS